MDDKFFWFKARRKVWAWIHGNKDEIDALRDELEDVKLFLGL